MPLYRTAYRSRASEPADHGYLGWTNDTETAWSAGTIQVSGNLLGRRVPVPYTISTTNAVCYVSTPGVTLTSAQNLIGLYTSAGAKIAQTADQSAVWTTGGAKVAAWTSGPFTIVGGPGVYVYVAFLCVGTTPPVFRGGTSPAAFITIGQASGLGAASTFQASQTTIPTTFAPTTTSAISPWAALS